MRSGMKRKRGRSMALCLAPRADRLGLPILLQGERPLEEGRGCGLRFHRLLGHELRPGEQRPLRTSCWEVLI